MEQLLFLLFVLFSIVSALLERRKRRKQLEEQQQRRAERMKRQEQKPEPVSRPRVEEPEEEEEVTGWPFGGDPFEPEPSRPRQFESQAERAERSALEREREALAAERRALEVERMALESVRRTEGGALRQRMSDLLRQRAGQGQAAPAGPAAPVRVGRWTLDPARARDAIVYAEILGRPRAERPDIQ